MKVRNKCFNNILTELFYKQIEKSALSKIIKSNFTILPKRKIKIWKGGICKDCNSVIIWSTFVCNNDELDDTIISGDYSIWCSNIHCINHKREEIYDMSVPEYYKRLDKGVK